MTMVDPRKRREESSALGMGSAWEYESNASSFSSQPLTPSNRLPAEGRILPIVVYLATDFREHKPLDNGDIGLLGMIQTSAKAGMRICRWEPNPQHPLEGRAVATNPLDPTAPEAPVETDLVCNWPGGVSLVARWPGDEKIVDAAIVIFTGPHGGPRVVRDASNIAVHRADRIAGYGSGVDYAAYQYGSFANQAFHVITVQQAEDVHRATGATDISVGGARFVAQVKGGTHAS